MKPCSFRAGIDAFIRGNRNHVAVDGTLIKITILKNSDFTLKHQVKSYLINEIKTRFLA